MTTPAIAIVGGGPCGLTLARLLECKGIDYVVFERDESDTSNRVGGSLDIHGDTGQEALRQAGLIEEFKKYARYDDTAFVLTDKDGKRLLQMGEGRDAPEIDRVALRQILLDAIPKEKIRWGHALTSAMMGEDKRPVLRFANGTEASGFKLVVGADGAWSKIRSLITKATPQYSGKIFIESKIGHENPLYQTLSKSAGAGMLLSIGPKKLVVTQRQGDGHYRNYFGILAPEDFFRNGTVNLGDTEATRSMLLSDFYADWSTEHKDLIKHATDFRAWTLYTLAPEDMNWKSVPGVALAGDAAHLAITNGEGVNLAMTDSLNLATKIVQYGIEHVDQAVQEYEAEMFPRGVATIKMGHQMIGSMYGGDPKAFLDALMAEGAQEV
ncbi:FAD/NAD(P)-binding domain-containing protein [Microthyrium microscopicum]|uniref:FAD/NAD(P)-binding domain-containing protein n=1 Tax=Microthyrium microscopicum TaxID=703497 RepID=A0A6A6U1D1_9PEZI|nr:FAD/NAD(P)-binding domain-containing protein [Microthyrium microscopicum]